MNLPSDMFAKVSKTLIKLVQLNYVSVQVGGFVSGKKRHSGKAFEMTERNQSKHHV